MKEFIPDEDFVEGQKVGKLTVVSVRPFKQVCECGTHTAWTRSALRKNGVRSCGCGFRSKSYRAQAGDSVGIYAVLERLTDARWRVRCSLCQHEQVLAASTINHCRHRKCSKCA